MIYHELSVCKLQDVRGREGETRRADNNGEHCDIKNVVNERVITQAWTMMDDGNHYSQPSPAQL